MKKRIEKIISPHGSRTARNEDNLSSTKRIVSIKSIYEAAVVKEMFLSLKLVKNQLKRQKNTQSRNDLKMTILRHEIPEVASTLEKRSQSRLKNNLTT
jgi:hypothetical protein